MLPSADTKFDYAALSIEKAASARAADVRNRMWVMERLINPTACMKDRVITASIWHPSATDREIAAALFCTVATVRKWRRIAHQYSITTIDGAKMRLKNPAYGEVA